MTAQTVETAQTGPAVAPLDFAISSLFSNRPSFDLPTVTLGATTQQQNPIQIPAVGYLHGILLRILIEENQAGTGSAWAADGPYNVIENVMFRNPGGANLIPNFTGYQLFLTNLFGGYAPGVGPAADPRAGIHGIGSYSDPTNLFLWIPIGIDLSEGYGSIPALAANAAYNLQITLAANASVVTGSPAPVLDVTIEGTAYFFTVPDQVAPGTSIAQSTTPPGMPAVQVWNVETPTVSPGAQLVPFYNVGGAIRNHIFVLRDATGARTDADWPDQFELYINNQVRFDWSRAEWEFMMTRWFSMLAQTKDVANGLCTGVYAIPYHALLGSVSGDPANTRAQIMPTETGTQIQGRFTQFGASASRLEILTQSISTTNAGYLFSK